MPVATKHEKKTTLFFCFKFHNKVNESVFDILIKRRGEAITRQKLITHKLSVERFSIPQIKLSCKSLKLQHESTLKNALIANINIC